VIDAGDARRPDLVLATIGDAVRGAAPVLGDRARTTGP
jgi:hypothetical protein